MFEDKVMVVGPVTLTGRYVRLEPMLPEHVDELYEVGADPTLWRWTTNRVGSHDDLRDYVNEALAAQATGRALPFITRELTNGTVIGSTRFGEINREHKRVEIGWTWIAPRWQRTSANTEAKLLMLSHAFDTWGCVRVELKTDALNDRSRAAIERIGARLEGTLRNHMIAHDGRLRDTVYYSILAPEWPQIKTLLESKLERK